MRTPTPTPPASPTDRSRRDRRRRAARGSIPGSRSASVPGSCTWWRPRSRAGSARLHACAVTRWAPTPFGAGAAAKSNTTLHVASSLTSGPTALPSQKNCACGEAARRLTRRSTCAEGGGRESAGRRDLERRRRGDRVRDASQRGGRTGLDEPDHPTRDGADSRWPPSVDRWRRLEHLGDAAVGRVARVERIDGRGRDQLPVPAELDGRERALRGRARVVPVVRGERRRPRDRSSASSGAADRPCPPAADRPAPTATRRSRRRTPRTATTARTRSGRRTRDMCGHRAGPLSAVNGPNGPTAAPPRVPRRGRRHSDSGPSSSRRRWPPGVLLQGEPGAPRPSLAPTPAPVPDGDKEAP